jgi:tetratricopeptide (TPR) repeat protein
MEAVLCAGFGGNIKIWVNDKLILSEQEEFNTDLDVLKANCTLKKGANRILLQIGNNATSAANFAIRLTDKNYATLQGLTFSDVYQAYTKDNGSFDKTKVIAFEPETTFLNKIKSEPNNLINYYLLSEIYTRNRKYPQAQKITAEGFAKAPDNSIFKYAMMQCLAKVNNRTELVQLLEDIKEKDPKCLISYDLRIDQLTDEEKYEEAMTLLNEQIEQYGVTESSTKSKIELTFKQEKLELGVSLIRDAYAKYPESQTFMQMWANVQDRLYKDPRKALSIYEDYLDDNFSASLLEDVGNKYLELGDNSKAIKIFEKLADMYAYDPSYLTKLVNYYYTTKNNQKAMEYAQKCLKISPYNSSYWENMGLLHEQNKNEKEAIAAYRKGLHYNPNAYDVRKK